MAFCEDHGKVLCDASTPCTGQGCNYDFVYQWTNEACPPVVLTPEPTSAPTAEPTGLDVEPVQFAWGSQAGQSSQALVVSTGTPVTFSWGGTHNVWEVPDATAFDACDLSGATEVASSSVQTVDVAAPGATPTTKFYVCTIGSHCASGTKVAITWAATTQTPTPQPTPGGYPAEWKIELTCFQKCKNNGYTGAHCRNWATGPCSNSGKSCIQGTQTCTDKDIDACLAANSGVSNNKKGPCNY